MYCLRSTKPIWTFSYQSLMYFENQKFVGSEIIIYLSILLLSCGFNDNERIHSVIFTVSSPELQLILTANLEASSVYQYEPL